MFSPRAHVRDRRPRRRHRHRGSETAVTLNIQTLRVLFTLLVVTAHLDSIYALLGVERVTMALANISVDGFIVASAFLIPYTHAQRTRPPLGFLGRRLARLVPFYWFMTLAVAALALIAPQLFQNTVVTAETLFKSLFFIPYFKYSNVSEPIVFVGWTMNYFIFYILLHTLSLRFAGAWAWLSTSLVLTTLVISAGYSNLPMRCWRRSRTRACCRSWPGSCCVSGGCACATRSCRRRCRAGSSRPVTRRRRRQ